MIRRLTMVERLSPHSMKIFSNRKVFLTLGLLLTPRWKKGNMPN
jgi:hypothetical protein